MKTALDQSLEIYRLLNVPTVTGLLSGRVYKDGKRPANSKLEDIVINTLTLGDGTRQLGVSNVHIYVPDLVQKIGTVDEYFANTSRLQVLMNVVKPILEETDGDDFYLYISQTELIEEMELKCHFMHLRVEFTFITQD